MTALIPAFTKLNARINGNSATTASLGSPIKIGVIIRFAGSIIAVIAKTPAISAMIAFFLLL